jgi:multidrug efflux pump subunit AcrA (membrane-fusion protein)
MTEHSPAQNSENARPPISGGKAIVLLLVLLVVAGILAVTGIVPRLRARTKLQQETNELAAPNVLVGKPNVGEPSQELILPGNMQAFTDSPIYARTNGYLKKWYFDIGAHVRKGQLLAVIESPEIDQELVQAKADLATAQANAHNAQIQSARYQDLLKSNAVSAQDTDTFTTQAKSTDTQVQSALANVQRLEQLVDFENVYAPFDGTVTVRNVDIGALINAGAGNSPGSELFHLAEFPGRTFTGKIVRTAKAIDLTSRTLLVEVDVENRKGELYPGAYAQVHFKLNNTHPAMIVPVSTLMFRSEGLRVAIVQNNKATLVPITIGRDDGRTVEVIQGLNDSDEVIQNPPDSLIDGETVHIVQPAQTGQPQPSGGDKPEPSQEGGK